MLFRGRWPLVCVADEEGVKEKGCIVGEKEVGGDGRVLY